MTSKLVWHAGGTVKGWFGRIKGLVMTQVDIGTSELVDVPLPDALKHVFDELDSLRKQKGGMQREIHDLLRDKKQIADTANELAKENTKLRKHIEFMRLPATTQKATIGAAMSTAQLSAVEMIRSLEEARAKIEPRPDLFSNQLRDILDSVAKRASGGLIPLNSVGLFGERSSETLLPRPPSSEFAVKAVPGACISVKIGSNMDASALADRVGEALTAVNPSWTNKQ